MVQGLPPPLAGGIFQTLAREAWLVLHRLDENPGGAMEAAVPDLDGRSPGVRAKRRPDHDGRRRRLSVFDVWVRHFARTGTARGSRIPAAGSHRARDLEWRQAARNAGTSRQS